MPTYEYECSSCGHRFEEFQPMSAKALKKCPECGKSALERLIGLGAGIIFKGGGFYETDYRSDSYKKAADAESKGSGAGNSSTDTKHTHTDACACGQKTKSECASTSASTPATSGPKESGASASSGSSAGSSKKSKSRASAKR